MKKALYLLAILVLSVGIALAQTGGTGGTTGGAQAGGSAEAQAGGTAGTAADDQTAPADQQQADQAAQGEQLPQTASPLPLLALLGLTSLGGAVLSRRRKQ
jgi:LPXTG-motif cell wall-anchored protein